MLRPNFTFYKIMCLRPYLCLTQIPIIMKIVLLIVFLFYNQYQDWFWLS